MHLEQNGLCVFLDVDDVSKKSQFVYACNRSPILNSESIPLCKFFSLNPFNKFQSQLL
jgi:hypothetical protein